MGADPYLKIIGPAYPQFYGGILLPILPPAILRLPIILFKRNLIDLNCARLGKQEREGSLGLPTA